MADTVRVRPATASDGPAIGQAHATAWVAAYDHIFDWDFLLAAATSRRVGWPQAIDRLLGEPNVLLAGEVDGRVVAFSHARPAEGVMAEVTGFYCHPAAWGTGVAALLMDETRAALAEEHEEVVLWTLRDAARARHFYENVGFRTTGNERSEPLADWSTGVAVECPAVQYVAPLRP